MVVRLGSTNAVQMTVERGGNGPEIVSYDDNSAVGSTFDIKLRIG
jgi:hypothetical protein